MSCRHVADEDLPQRLQHHNHMHQSLAEWQEKRKERQSLYPTAQPQETLGGCKSNATRAHPENEADGRSTLSLSALSARRSGSCGAAGRMGGRGGRPLE